MPSIIKTSKNHLNSSKTFTSLNANNAMLANGQKVDLSYIDEEYFSSNNNEINENYNEVQTSSQKQTTVNNKYSELNKYTPEGKTYFGTPGMEVKDAGIGLATIGMGTLAVGEGLGNYIGNNFIALASIFHLEEEAYGAVNYVGDGWSSLFQDSGALDWLNDMSLLKYNDEGWQNGSLLGHALSVGAGRYLAEKIPYGGPVVAAALTYGDGFGSAYRSARANGTDVNTAGLIGIGNGFFQALSFTAPGLGANIAIGAAMPLLDTLFVTLGEPSSEDFFDSYAKNFEANGGIKALGISIVMYGINSYAHILNGGTNEFTKMMSTDTVQATSRIQMLQEKEVNLLDTPFITTALNAFMNTIIPNFDASILSKNVPSQRPI